MSVCQRQPGRECVIIFATITSVDTTAHADKDTFSMTTIDPAQVIIPIQASLKLFSKVQRLTVC